VGTLAAEEAEVMPTFAAIVSETGLQFIDRAGWRRELQRHVGRQITVEVHGPRRSNEANRRYWGRIVKTLRALWSVGREVPLTKSQVHHVLVRSFLGEEETPLGWVPVETKHLPSEAFSEFMDKIEGHFASLGVEFLEPGEDEDGL
jgi:hypothetical protein